MNDADSEVARLLQLASDWRHENGGLPVGKYPPRTEELVEDLERALADADRATKDDPEMDATDFAHPAWWRGEQAGVRGAVETLRKVLDGKDDGSGVISDPELERLRRDLLARR